MSRQAILDNPASALPQLRQFLGGYFHQDWMVDRRLWTEVVEDFIVESPRSAVLECASELRDLLAADFDETELATVLERLGCSVDPSALHLRTDEWLREVLERLRRELETA
jgi:CdiI immunity protein